MPMNSIDIFPWSDNFNTGLPKVDEQHRKLVQLLNLLANQVAFNADIGALDRIFDELAEYAVYHFATEEAIWHEYLADDSAEAEHQAIHQFFIQEVGRLKASQTSNPLSDVAEETLGFLARWLVSHILEHDRQMAYVVLALREGVPLEAAKLRAKEQMGGTTRALIDIILSIYSALSAKTLHLVRELSAHRQDKEALLRASTRLQESEGNLRTFFDSINDFLFVLDEQRNIIQANRTVLDRLGYAEADLVGQNALKVRAAEHHEEALRIMADMVAGIRESCPLPLLAADGQLIPVETRVSAGQWNGQPALFAVSRDVSERKKAEAALRESENRFRTIFELSPDPMWIIDNHRFVDCNDSAMRMLGYRNKAEFLNKHPSELSPEYQPDGQLSYVKAEDLMSQANKAGVYRFEWVHVRADGSEFDAEVTLTRMLLQDQPIMYCIWRDITERNTAEKRLKESERRFDLAMRAANDGLWDWDMQTNAVYYSPRWKSMLGYADLELENAFSVWEQLTDEAGRARTMAMIGDCIEGRADGFVSEFRMRHKDGHWVDVLSRAILIRDEAGNALRMVGTHVDISEHKRIERELKTRERYQRALLDNFPFLIWLKDKESRFLAVNRPFAEACKRDSADELAGLTDLDVWPADLAEAYRTDDREVLSSGRAKQVEETIETPDGRVWFETYKSPVMIDDEVLGTVGFARDITDRKNAEAALLKSESSLAEAQHLAKIGSWELDIPSNQLRWSDEIYRIFEIDPTRFGASYDAFLDAIHPDDRETVNMAYSDSLRTREPYNIRHRLRMADGRIKYVHEQCRSEFDADGTPLRSIGTVQDVTGQVLAEQSLQESRNLLQLVIDNVPMRVFWKDRALSYLGSNPLFARDAGKDSPSEMVGKDDYQMGWSREADRYRADDRQVIDSGIAKINFVEPQTTPDGRTIWLRTSKVPLRSSANEVIGVLGIYDDITERKQMEDELLEAKAEAERLLDEAGDREFFLHQSQQVGQIGGWRADPVSNSVMWTEGVYEIVEMPQDYRPDLETALDFYLPDSRLRVVEHLQRALATGESFTIQVQLQGAKSAQVKWVELRGHPHLNDEGHIDYLMGTLQDVSERMRAEIELKSINAFNHSLIETMIDGVAVCHGVCEPPYVEFTVWNTAMKKLTGYSIEDINKLGWYQTVYVDPEVQDKARQRMERMRQGDNLNQEEWEITRKDGDKRTVEITTVVLASSEKGGHVMAVMRDITRRKRAETKIAQLAFFDPLTGLPNRTLLQDRIKKAMASSQRTGAYGALLLIDLDHFKTINDTLGHDMGDLLLKQVAQRLTDCVREEDTVARLGGDEFVVMLVNLSNNLSEAVARVEMIGRKIGAVLNSVFELDEATCHTSMSAGASVFLGRQTNIDTLLKQADLALYKAKDAGRNTLRFFDPDMARDALKRAALERDLHDAVQNKQFVVHYQAQISGGQITGAESLLRWQHPVRGLVAPGEFIAVIEESGLICPVGQWVLETACQQLAEWSRQSEMSHLTISVNVSAHQLNQEDFVDQVVMALDRTGANPRRLKLELTESLLVNNVEKTIGKMIALKAKGVGFSLDDFGTGYSSLTYLKRLPLDQLKIDLSFVRDILSDPNDVAIAKMIVLLADSLGLDVIAEGVETEAQRDLLAQLGCHAYQGYWFSRPLPIDEFESYAKRGFGKK